MGISLERFLRQLGINPGDVAVNVPLGSTPFYGRAGEDTEGSQSFALASGTALDTRLSFLPGSVVVDNNTSDYINLPDATKDGTGRWVPPGGGAAMPLLGSVSRARVNWTSPPGRNQPAFIAGEQAQFVFFAARTPPSFGYASPLPTVRWNLSSQPIDNVQATVTKAAAAGVTHIGDWALGHWVNDSGAAAGILLAMSLIDGTTGQSGYLARVVLCLGGIGTTDGSPWGPGLNARGTPGNAMTFEGGNAVASTRQSVSLNGYDQ